MTQLVQAAKGILLASPSQDDKMLTLRYCIPRAIHFHSAPFYAFEDDAENTVVISLR